MTVNKKRIAVAAIVMTLLILVSCSQQESVFFDIAEGPADSALDAFASQSSTEIIYSVEEMQAIRTNRVYGRYTRDEALQQLLEGTPLAYSSDEKSGAIAVWNRNLKIPN